MLAVRSFLTLISQQDSSHAKLHLGIDRLETWSGTADSYKTELSNPKCTKYVKTSRSTDISVTSPH